MVTVSGRYYAMDRDNRWERVAQAYDAMVKAMGETAANADEAIATAYARGETDEFIKPTVLTGYHGIHDNDGVFFLNFRADRAREILRAIGEPGFCEFDVGTRPAEVCGDFSRPICSRSPMTLRTEAALMSMPGRRESVREPTGVPSSMY